MLPLRDRLATRRFPVVNTALIAVNVLAFIWERVVIAAGAPARHLVFAWGLVPARFLDNPIEESVTVLSSLFLHDPTNWVHLGGNMLFLWIFGDNVEDALGRRRYLTFYLACGIAAAGAQILIDPTSVLPMVGASGAIAGVLAAYGSLYPRAPITVLNPVLPLWLFFGVFLEFPAWVIILEFFLFNLWNGLGSIGSSGGGVAFFAHLGGFVAGLLLVRISVAHGPHTHERWQSFRTPTRRAATGSMPRSGHDEAPRRGPWDW